ncbi:TonB-dependent receptor [Hyphomonas sp.]|uniref:TonB-dependent receptor n=1 Tax=Hyphomonas sp. TaxID=87 RepID=UPI0025C5F493|nr:TonB-dependent receptor [Hyphomonas sp.]MBI1399306.1 TonB-dependent receptor plug domain-containing protein [Hyphomonas sp.]
MKRLISVSSAALLALSATAQAQSGADPADTEETRVEETVVVTAARTILPPSALPTTIQLISNEDLALQAKLTGSAVDVVSTLVPSFSPTREKMSGAGESLRGRKPLYLIDGVPQSNPLRDGSRAGYTIDPFFIDRVEVIFGSNAIQGIGATGGVVNYVTVAAPTEEDVWTGKLLAQFSAANEFQGDGYESRTGAVAGRDFGLLDLTLGVSAQTRGAYYSGDGRRVGIDGTQGEVQNSTSLSFFAKAGYDLGDARRLELMAQHFKLEGDGNYVLVSGSRATNTPTTTVRGSQEGEIPNNKVLTTSLTYSDKDLAGGLLTGQLFFQDFEAVYGGGVFDTFQDPAIDPTGTLFDQSANNSEKMGLRLSYERALDAVPGLNVTGGLDVLNDKTYQELIKTGRNWVPETEFTSYAPFVQLNQALFGKRVHVSGGLRHEMAQLKVADYETLYSYGPQQVGGGEPDFQKTLVNAGVTAEVVPGLTAYTSYAEGFTMADVGRILRAISTPGEDVDTFLNVEPVVTDNTEIGLEWRRGPLSASAAYFWSTAELGSLLILRNDIFEVERQRTEIEGLELNAAWETPVDGLKLSAGYAALEGQSDSNGDGRVDQDLDGANISPDRVNLAADFERGPFALRLQSRSYLDRTFDGLPASSDFDGYTLADAFLRYSAPFGNITLSAANLFDEQYVTYDSQTVRTTSNDRFFAGRGRVISLAFEKAF